MLTGIDPWRAAKKNRTPLPGSGGLAAGSLLAGKAPTFAGREV